MKYGMVFPQNEIGNDPLAIRDLAQAAEGMGYAYLLTYDHVLGANPDRPGWEGWRPYSYEHAFHEPLVLFGYLAGQTHTLELVTGVLILPQRQTALVAKQAAEIDVLSGGRLRLGVGIGWNDVEYVALDQDFHKRGLRIEEQVALMRELWMKPLVVHDGPFDHIPDAGINPLPVQRPIPVWMGGGADAVLRRMARMADGWFPQGPVSSLRESLDKLRGYLESAGRGMDDFGLDARLNLARVPETERDAYVEDWRAAGATHLSVNTMGLGLTPQGHIDALRQFMDGR